MCRRARLRKESGIDDLVVESDNLTCSLSSWNRVEDDVLICVYRDKCRGCLVVSVGRSASRLHLELMRHATHRI